MDKALAETIGKRLERQGERVRPTLAAAAEVAEAAAVAARAASASDPELALEQTCALVNADSAASDAYEKLRDEVYIGFHELDALLQLEDVTAIDGAGAGEGEGDGRGTVSSTLRGAIVNKLVGEQVDQDGLLQRALDHIITLEGRLDVERSCSAELRAKVVSARGYVSQADARVAEAEERVAAAERRAVRAERKLEEVERQHESELEDARLESDMEHIGEKNELKARNRGLAHELALLKGVTG